MVVVDVESVDDNVDVTVVTDVVVAVVTDVVVAEVVAVWMP